MYNIYIVCTYSYIGTHSRTCMHGIHSTHYYPCNAATYSHLGNRGYAPQGQNQRFEAVDDPTYSRLDEFQRPGDPRVINRGAPPNPNQQNLMMQQGGGGAGGVGGMGMGQQRMGMGPQPGIGAGAAAMLPHQHQQYNPQAQPGGQMAPNMQYRQPQLQQRQQSMNTQSYLGVPQQLVIAQPGAAQEPQHQLQQAPPPAPAPAPAPAKPKESQGWICPQCTLVNNPRRPGCELCSCARPDDYKVPEEAPLADFEKRAKENEALFEQVKKKYFLYTS